MSTVEVAMNSRESQPKANGLRVVVVEDDIDFRGSLGLRVGREGFAVSGGARRRAILAHVVRTRELRSKVSILRGELRHLGRFGPMVGRSPSMRRVYELISKVAPTRASVLITGESGTGKELVSQTLHRMSPRAGRPFLAVNCGAVAPSVIESELF